jgi:hypothetical protein
VFVCRHAGNFADEETIASFEYGVAVLNVPLLMVLGHERLRPSIPPSNRSRTTPPCPAICRR